MLIEENIFLLIREIKGNGVPEDLDRLRVNVVESLHAMLVTCMESAGKESDLKQIIFMTSDKGSLMEKIRSPPRSLSLP
jgi:hypothetical protein